MIRPLDGVLVVALEQAIAAPYSTADGSILFGLQNEREWARFVTIVLERPELAEDPRFNSNGARANNAEATKKAGGFTISSTALTRSAC